MKHFTTKGKVKKQWCRGSFTPCEVLSDLFERHDGTFDLWFSYVNCPVCHKEIAVTQIRVNPYRNDWPIFKGFIARHG